MVHKSLILLSTNINKQIYTFLGGSPQTIYRYLFLFGLQSFNRFSKRSRVVVTHCNTVVIIFEEENLLRMIGFREGLGSGFPLILDAWKEKQWPSLELVEEQDLMQVKLVLKIGINKGNVLKNVSKNVRKELSDRQLNIIQFIQESPDSAWAEMSERLKVSSKTIQRDIKDMQEKGILSREDGRADGYWVIHDTDQ